MATLDALPTPALLVEKHRLEENIASMQEVASQAGVALRPHTKTHKSVFIASMQRAAGASGITVAKVGEAEVFAEAGFDDIRIAYCVVGAEKMRRIVSLSRRCRVSFCVDTPAGARLASEGITDADQTADVEVLIEVDTGQGRTGVPWDDDHALVELASVIRDSAGIRFAGLLTHGGFGYYGPRGSESSADALQRAALDERERVLRAARTLVDAGIEVPEISVGSTPTLRYFGGGEAPGGSAGTGDFAGGGPRITEVRPGNYVFLDRTQVGLGVAKWTNCALTVLTTVISLRRDSDGTERLYLDAGKKVFTSDGAFGMEGYGQILYNPRAMVPLPHATIVSLSEEHAWVKVRGGATADVGDTLRVVPNHACVVVNNFDEMYLVDGDEVVETLAVSARGRVT